MIDVKVKDSDIRKAVEEGMDSFVQVFVDAIGNAIDNKLTLETMQQLNADQPRACILERLISPIVVTKNRLATFFFL